MQRARRLCLVCLTSLLVIAGTAQAKQATATGTGGAVASDTVQATNAGLAILERGGTAADAAVLTTSRPSWPP